MHRSAAAILALLLTAATLTLATAGPARADPHERRLARLRAEASRLNARIDRDNQEVSKLVEAYNAGQVTLDATRRAEAATRQRLTAAEVRLRRATQQLHRRARAIYINRRGPLTSIAQLLGVATLHQALTTLQYQKRVIRTDQALVAEVRGARGRLAEATADLRAQRAEQERLQRRLRDRKRAIQERLARQREALARVGAEVQQVMRAQRAAAERRRAAAAARYAARVRPAFVGVSAAGAGAAGRAVAWALAQLGKPYRWGATGLATFDCSGLTMRAYQAAGVRLPRTSRAQWSSGPHVPRSRLRPGDLLFFGGSPATIHHVAMYVGGGRMVEAPYTGARVRVASMFRDNYVGAVRPTA